MRCSLRAPEKTSKRPAGRAASISTSAGSSKYSTPLAHTPTPTQPTQARAGPALAQRRQQGLGKGGVVVGEIDEAQRQRAGAAGFVPLALGVELHGGQCQRRLPVGMRGVADQEAGHGRCPSVQAPRLRDAVARLAAAVFLAGAFFAPARVGAEADSSGALADSSPASFMALDAISVNCCVSAPHHCMGSTTLPTGLAAGDSAAAASLAVRAAGAGGRAGVVAEGVAAQAS